MSALIDTSIPGGITDLNFGSYIIGEPNYLHFIKSGLSILEGIPSSLYVITVVLLLFTKNAKLTKKLKNTQKMYCNFKNIRNGDLLILLRVINDLIIKWSKIIKIHQI